MKEKRNFKYKIILEEIENKEGAKSDRQVQFDFSNHDDILQIIAQTQNQDRFKEKGDIQEFVLGMKLFSEVMLRNKENELFKEFLPEFAQFMKKLKGKESK